MKPKELSILFGVTPRAITEWAIDWINKGILEPSYGSKRITEYKLVEKYSSLKISNLGFTD